MTIAATATELRTQLRDERATTGKPASRKAFADFHIHTRFSRDSLLSEETVHREGDRARPDARRGHEPQQRGGRDRRPRQGRRARADRQADGHPRRGGLDRRRRGRRPLPREDDPARPERQRDRRRDPSAGRAGQHPASVRPVPGLSHQGGAAAQPGRRRQDRHGRGLQLPGHVPAPQPRGRGVRGAARDPGHRGVRQPLELRGRDGLQRDAALRDGRRAAHVPSRTTTGTPAVRPSSSTSRPAGRCGRTASTPGEASRRRPDRSSAPSRRSRSAASRSSVPSPAELPAKEKEDE